MNDWIGRSEQQREILMPWPAGAWAASTDRDDVPTTGEPLPPLWQWFYGLAAPRRADLAVDGLAQHGGLLPPLPLPRRMFAGARLGFARALRIGAEVTRRAWIDDMQSKSGRSGALVFLRLGVEWSDAQGVAISERQDIVYREAAGPGEAGPAASPAPPDPPWTRSIVPDEVLLFRYSALTFNSHRIHYDVGHATQIEGYEGLIVHGPLIATLMLDHLRDRWRTHRPGERVLQFDFRALRPIVHTRPFAVCAEPRPDGQVHVWARDADGALCMDATATLG